VKITKHGDIYTNKITVEMTEAEWEFITGLASTACNDGVITAGSAAKRLAKGSRFYWHKGLDYSKLFTSEE
jgi:hypothetical protein